MAAPDFSLASLYEPSCTKEASVAACKKTQKAPAWRTPRPIGPAYLASLGAATIHPSGGSRATIRVL